MENTPKWEFHWFGWWSWPTPRPGSPLPFLLDWIVQAWQPGDRIQIIDYLDTCPDVVVAANGTYQCPLCEEQLHKTLVRSDGEWTWPDSLPHMMRSHGVRVPEEFATHIREVGYTPPSSVTVHPRHLPWPPRES